jgi:uracil-DNA glycosylase
MVGHRPVETGQPRHLAAQLHEDAAGGRRPAAASTTPAAPRWPRSRKRRRTDGSIRTLAELQDNLLGQGFLLLNASLVFRKHVAPVVDARAWLPFQRAVFAALAERRAKPTLVLWGKIAEQLKKVPETAGFPHIASEHPYNLSFIGHEAMQQLFAPMQLLRRP